MHDRIEWLLENYDLEEAFEILDISPYEVVALLMSMGLVALPPFLEHEDGRAFKEQEASNATQAEYAGESLED